MILKVPYVSQKAPNFCGPACLRMVFAYYGVESRQEEIAEFASLGHDDALPNKKMGELARAYGLEAKSQEGNTIKDIKDNLKKSVPVIVNFIEPDQNEGHYAVVVGYEKDYLIMNDPWNGPSFRITEKEFENRWRAGFESKYHWMLIIQKSKVL